MTINLAGQLAPMDLSSTIRRAVVTYTGPAAYVTGGDPVDAEQVRMGKIFGIAGAVAQNGATFYLLRLSGPPSTTQTILWIVAATGLEVANGVDLSGATAILEFMGQ